MRSAKRVPLGALAQRAARAYVVGPGLADAVRACGTLRAQGFRSTVCYWNAASDEPRAVADRYLDAIDAIGDRGLDCYASVKAPALRFSRELSREICERARRRNVAIHFDSLAQQTTDETFALIREMLPVHRELGCTLPGRWRRSLADADRSVDLGLKVRVVKGEWPASGDAIDPRGGFMMIINRLAGRARHVAVATHDAVLARESLSRLRAAGTPCELELLHRLPLRKALHVARTEDVPVRMYVPYGNGSLPYALWQVKEHPRIAWWMLRDIRAAGRPTLLKSP